MKFEGTAEGKKSYGGKNEAEALNFLCKLFSKKEELQKIVKKSLKMSDGNYYHIRGCEAGFGIDLKRVYVIFSLSDDDEDFSIINFEFSEYWRGKLLLVAIDSHIL